MILTKALPARPAAEPLDTCGSGTLRTHSLAPISASGLLKGKEASLPPPRVPHPLRYPGSVGVPTWGGGSQKRLGPQEMGTAPAECQTPILSPTMLRPPPRSHWGNSSRASSASPAYAPLCSQAVNHLSDRTCPPHTCLPAPSSWGHASSPHGAPAWAPAAQETGSRWAHGRPGLYRPFTQAREGWALKAPHPHLPCPTPPGERRLLTGTTGPRRLVLEGAGHPTHQNTAGLAQRWCLAEGPGAPRGYGHHTQPARPPVRPRAPGPKPLSSEEAGRPRGRPQGQPEPSRGGRGGQGGRQPTRPSRAERHALHNSSKSEPPPRRQQRVHRAPRRGGPSEAAAAR